MQGFFAGLVARRWLVLVLALGVVAGGVLNLRGFAVDAVPDISPKQVMVLTQATGLGPLEVERLVTVPVEYSMAGLPGLKSIRSTSRFGLSAVYVTFQDATDLPGARSMVMERLGQARQTMPAGVGSPQMGPIATGLGEVYQFEVRGPGHTPMELRQILQWTIAPKLRLVPGITDVNIYGGQMRTFEVRIGADALRAHNLTMPQVFQALSDNNATRGGAYLTRGDEQVVVRGMALAKTAADIAGIVLQTAPDGVPLTIGGLGEVVEAPKVRLGAVTHDDRGETVVGVALMQYGDNASQVIAGVKAAVEEIGKQLPAGIELRPYYDRSDLVARTISTVEHNLAEGAVLVVAVLLLMLGNLRAGLIVACAIPISMLMAFAGMRALGISGNLMSLGAIDFGLVVDGAVVMIENVLRRRAAAGKEDDPGKVIWTAAAEVARPVAFGVLIISMVYLPVLALQGVEGKMFRPMAIAVMLALLSSLLVTILVMPALAAAFLGDKTPKETWLVRKARAGYTPVLRRAERHPLLILLVAAGLFGGSVFMATRLGGEFLPQLSEGSIVITSEKLPGISLDASLRIAGRIEAVLRGFPEVTRVVSLTGSAEIPTDPMGVESTDSFVSLKPQAEWQTASNQDGLVAAYEAKLKEQVPGVAFTFSQPIQMRMDDLLQGVRGDVAITIYGDDLATLRGLADQVVQAVDGVQGAADVKAEQQGGLPALTVQVDRAKVARYGLNAADVLAVVETVGGRSVGTVYGDDDSQTDIVVRLPAADRTDVSRLRELPVGNAQGRTVPLSEVADIAVATGPAQISRERLQRRIAVQSNVRGRDAQSFVTEAQKAVGDKVHLPPKYSIDWSGQFQNLQDATARLVVVVPIALAVIFLLLYLQFSSVRLALLIFLNVPMAATGGIAALMLRGLPFSISAAIGFIATFGIAILNGLVLTTTIEAERAEGKSARDAAASAAESRLRPVLTTALVASLGFIPMAISTSAGAEVQRPLATVVIGGLITATLLTLVVLPSLYPVVTEFKWPSLRRIGRGKATVSERPAE